MNRDLAREVLWPTMTSSEAERGPNGNHLSREGGPNLSRAGLWPTATVGDSESSGSAGYPAKVSERTGKMRYAGTTLTDAAVRLFPTPSASTYGSSQNGCPGDGREKYAQAGKPSLEGMMRSTGGAALNPAWVECLMGFPLGWTDVGPLAATKTSQHAWEPPRSVPSNGDRTRRPRLKGLGNAVVPACAERACAELLAWWRAAA